MKKIMLIFLVTVLLALPAVSIVCASDVTFDNLTLEQHESADNFVKYTLEGNVTGKSSGSDVLVVVTSKGKTERIQTLPESDILYMNYFPTGESGSFSHEITLPKEVGTAIEEDGTSYQVILSTKGAENELVSFRTSVTDVVFETEELKMIVGETDFIVARVLPENATDKSLTWTSSNEGVVSVEDGEVTAKGVGTAIVTAMADGGRVSASCKVSVSALEKVDVVASSGGAIYSGDKITSGTESFESGTKVSFNAVPEANSQFMYWIDSTTKKILSETALLEMDIYADRKITAIFADGSQADECLVVFRGNNSIIKSEMIVKGQDAVGPADWKVYLSGCNFAGWDKPLTGITETTEFNASYVKKGDTCTVKVSGGLIYDGVKEEGMSEGTFGYNDVIWVVADPSEDGKVFAGWMADGQIVSFDEEYSFFVLRDVELTALYDEEVVKRPVLSMSVKKDSSGEYRIAGFTTERYLPEGFTFKETGVIYAKTLADASALTLENIGEKVSGKTVKASVSSSTEGTGQYKLNSSYSTDGVTARGYMVYLDIEGDLHVLYTDPYYVSE